MRFNISIEKIFLLIVILIILLTSLSFPQENPYRKVSKTYYPNGTIKTEGEYLYNDLDGHYKEYYASGKLWKDWNYSYGKEEGIST
jgi:hypothetical protein